MTNFIIISLINITKIVLIIWIRYHAKILNSKLGFQYWSSTVIFSVLSQKGLKLCSVVECLAVLRFVCSQVYHYFSDVIVRANQTQSETTVGLNSRTHSSLFVSLKSMSTNSLFWVSYDLQKSLFKPVLKPTDDRLTALFRQLVRIGCRSESRTSGQSRDGRTPRQRCSETSNGSVGEPNRRIPTLWNN